MFKELETVPKQLLTTASFQLYLDGQGTPLRLVVEGAESNTLRYYHAKPSW